MRKCLAFVLAAMVLMAPGRLLAAEEYEARDISDFVGKIAKDIAGYLKQAGAAEVAVVPFKNAENEAEFALSEVLTGALLQELRYSYSDFRILGATEGAPAFRVTGLWTVAGEQVRVTTRIVKMPSGDVSINYAAVIPLKRVPRVYVDPGKAPAREVADKGVRLAIMKFTGGDQYADLRPLAEGIPEALTTVFAKQSDLLLIERLQQDKIMAELGLADSKYTDPDAVVKLGKLLGANYMILGSFQKRGRKLRLMARRVKVETGEIFEAADVIGVEDDLFDLEDDLGAKLLKSIQKYR